MIDTFQRVTKKDYMQIIRFGYKKVQAELPFLEDKKK